MPDLIFQEPKNITHQPDTYFGWPTLTRLRNGDLMLVCSGGRMGHVCPFGRVEMLISHDEGETWSWPRVLLDGVIDDRDAGILETEKGTIIVNTFTSVAYRTHDWMTRASWQAADRRAGYRAHDKALGTWLIRSVDGGDTWSTRLPAPAQNPHGPIQLRDGRILLIGKTFYQERNFIGVWESTDEGLSWTLLHEFQSVGTDEPQRNYHELHGVEAADGTLIAQLRYHDDDGKGTGTLQSESHDGGKSWTPWHSIGVDGYPTHLLRLQDGRLIMVYSYRLAPYGIRGRVSTDHGASWGEEFIISDDGTNWDLGYPSTAELSNGWLITAWYECPAVGKGLLRQRLWRFQQD